MAQPHHYAPFSLPSFLYPPANLPHLFSTQVNENLMRAWGLLAPCPPLVRPSRPKSPQALPTLSAPQLPSKALQGIPRERSRLRCWRRTCARRKSCTWRIVARGHIATTRVQGCLTPSLVGAGGAWWGCVVPGDQCGDGGVSGVLGCLTL